MNPTPLASARDLLARGFAPIPVPHRTKKAVLKGWPQLRLGPDDLAKHFGDEPMNIGVLLGEPSGWIVDVDLDHDLAAELAATYLPPTHMSWGRDSRPRTHRLYRVSTPVASGTWDSGGHGMLVELRSTKLQTLAPGSVHPDGELVRWDDTGDPGVVDPDVLLTAINALAVEVKRRLGEPAETAPPAMLARAVKEGGSAYGRAALKQESERVAVSVEGTRNNTLNRAAFAIGQLVAGDEVDRADAESALAAAASMCGLDDRSARATIASGMDAGGRSPRSAPEDDADPDPRAGTSQSAASKLIGLAHERYRLGLSTAREPFAVPRGGPNVALLLGSSGGSFRDALAAEFFEREGKAASASAIADAVLALRGEAQRCQAEELHIRVARDGESIVIDLGTPDGAVVVASAAGWEVRASSPVIFRRTALTASMPRPEKGGTLAELRDVLNVTDDTWAALQGWMVAALIPDIPHPILLLGGLQGTGKTTAAKFICGVLDPSAAPTRSRPRDEEAWVMSIANGWACVIDNVSDVPEWWSDALCKAVTGDGWVRRTLFTDRDVTVIGMRRVVVLTSIDAGAMRGDLGERLLLVDLEVIGPNKRRAERDLQREYERIRPRVFGALLDLLVGVLGTVERVDLSELPRMADFARVLAAMDAVAGTGALASYLKQGSRVAQEVIECDPVGAALVKFLSDRAEWRGQCGELLVLIKPEAHDRTFPKNARALAGSLRRLLPALAQQGIEVVVPKAGDKRRGYFLRRIGTATAHTAQAPESRLPDTLRAVNSGAIGVEPPPDRPFDSPAVDGPRVALRAVSGRSGGMGGGIAQPVCRIPGHTRAWRPQGQTGVGATCGACHPPDGLDPVEWIDLDAGASGEVSL